MRACHVLRAPRQYLYQARQVLTTQIAGWIYRWKMCGAPVKESFESHRTHGRVCTTSLWMRSAATFRIHSFFLSARVHRCE